MSDSTDVVIRLLAKGFARALLDSARKQASGPSGSSQDGRELKHASIRGEMRKRARPSTPPTRVG